MRNIKQKVSQQPMPMSIEEMSKQQKVNNFPTPGGCKKPEVISLDSLESQRMERDRAGILFSNILSQVRGRVIQKEKLGSVADYITQSGNSQDTTFFKSSTYHIDYKKILGFQSKIEEEDECPPPVNNTPAHIG